MPGALALRELRSTITPVSIPAVWNALILRWETLGVPVLRAPIEIKLGHIHFETGLRACHCNNLGNIKSVAGDGCNWQYFACGEEIPATQLKAVRALGPGLVDVKRLYVRDGAPWVSIWIRMPGDLGAPRHPWTKFKAFATLEDGVDAQLNYLRRHPKVLAALQSGSVEAYNHALFEAHYHTTQEDVYLKRLQGRVRIVRAACKDFDWGNVA